MVYRIYVEKKKELANEAKALLGDINSLLGISNVTDLRVINRYDAEDIEKDLFDYAVKNVFSEPQLDITSTALTADGATVFAVEPLPGQFDQRADSAAQCIQIISQGERPTVKTAKVYLLYGDITAEELKEIKKDKLSDFAKNKDFIATNVTIPYKEQIMPYLYEIDEHAEKIGSVNTVVNRDGRLYGYNTDFFGMCALLRHAGVSIAGKKAAILGTGGTAKTAFAVLSALGAREILKVSRTKKNDAIDYGELYSLHSDTEIIINTTPVGMYPKIYDSPLDLSKFPNLSGVIDAIYNPLRTPLIMQAKKRKIAAEGGLYMLVAQGVRASEIFLDTQYPVGTIDEVYKKILKEKESVVLVGMPSSGKTTVGKILAERLSRKFIDTDEEIEKAAGIPICEIFKRFGEREFRLMESEAIRNAAAVGGAVIATGGGAVLKEENVAALKENGRLYFLDRSPEKLIPTATRPLASDFEAIKKRYDERYELYLKVSDKHINGDLDAQDVANVIAEDF